MAETLRFSLELAPLPNPFQGNPQQFAEAMTERLRVLFPSGIATFVIQDTEPDSNQGPWIKGDQIFLWNEEEKRYMPMDISNVWQVAISPTEPTDPTVSPIWIQYNGSIVTGVFVYLNGAWVPVNNLKGKTVDRPVKPPEYFRYFDTDIGCEIYWQGDMWRTMSGCKGDVKYVTHPILADALKYNPGWVEAGTPMASVRGRTLVAAHKDFGVTPAAIFPALTGVTARAATDLVGTEDVKLTVPQLPKHAHKPWEAAPVFRPNGGRSGGDGDNYRHYKIDAAEDALITAIEGNDEAHPNMQPSLVLWCLVKL